jgi:hypothetical protein
MRLMKAILNNTTPIEYALPVLKATYLKMANNEDAAAFICEIT